MIASHEYTAASCPQEGCGIIFFITKQYESRRRKDHALFYCPNGHCQHYSQDSGEDVLRNKLRAVENNAANLEKELALLRKPKRIRKKRTK